MIALNILLTMVYVGTQEQFNELNKEEERIIVHKGTERPFSGIYYNHFDPGIYLCRRCNSPLYESDSKFESGCGWPSFDDEIPGAVRRVPDADGMRTEIVCAKCGAHLGHVFLGEGLTPKDTRHCVNSLSISFAPEKQVQQEPKTERAIFAGGCFWGVEYFFRAAAGVLQTRVGYIGGNKENPTYEEVCSGTTGHAEAIEVVFDPSQTNFEALTRLFFETHDPTQVNRQGPDIGEQYRSAIFCMDDQQKSVALRLIAELRQKGYDIATQVHGASLFWPAEDYHQDYYHKKNGRPYCHIYQKRF